MTRYQNDILRSVDVLIRDLPDEVHAELARRAAVADMSLRAYLQQVLSDHVAVPTVNEWLDRVAALDPVDTGGLSGAEIVAATRDEDDDALAER